MCATLRRLRGVQITVLRLFAGVAALAALSLAFAGGLAQAERGAVVATHTYVLRARLSPRAEVPQVKRLPKAMGALTAKLTIAGDRKVLVSKLIFSGLSGAARSAQIRTGPPHKIGPIALFICAPCTSGMKRTLALGGKGYEKLVDQIVHGKTYVNVATAKHEGGEIRGQLRVVASTGS